VAAAVPAAQLVWGLGIAALVNPAGYASTKTDERVAEARACVLVIVMVNCAVPPARIEVGAKALLTNGRDDVTLSVSPAEQTPAVQDVDGLLLVTLAGGVIVAILVTWVWACAKPGRASAMSKATKGAHTTCAISTFSCCSCALVRPLNQFKSNHPNFFNRPASHVRGTWTGKSS
jgi:hypothetical protein